MDHGPMERACNQLGDETLSMSSSSLCATSVLLTSYDTTRGSIRRRRNVTYYVKQHINISQRTYHLLGNNPGFGGKIFI